MSPLLSIVSGTYNRLPFLKRFIQSVRDTLPPSIAYDFSICDGGSSDGTLEWLRTQPDVTLIPHGELKGALRAFGDAARAASGEYVLLGNDDITVHPGALLKAIVHLETHPQCGAVAFQDNRPAPGYGKDYKVQHIQGRKGNRQVRVPYPQVGMVRRWLGDEVGWWGDQHPIMAEGHTYGGDSFLGATLWELGFTVDEVDGCRIDDLIPKDALRETNHQAEQANPGVYYKVYPDGPVIAAKPVIESPQKEKDRERLRILYAPIFEPGYLHHRANKRGLREALQRVGLVYEWDYIREWKVDLAARCAEWQPHLVFLQLHGIDEITETDLAAAREVAPEAVFVNWNGDVYGEHLVSPPMLSLLRHIDLQLVVNANVLPTYAANGIKAAYWQVAFEPTDPVRVEELKKRAPSYDVVFLANAYTVERKRLGDSLRAMRDGAMRQLQVGLYGFGWNHEDGNTLYDFDAGAALYANSKIAIGDNQFGSETGFVSNRMFEALAAGAFLLHQHVNGLEALTGLTAGVHYVEWTDTGDLQRQIQHWIHPRQEASRKAIAAQGQAFVREYHSFDARVRQLFDELLPMLEDERELQNATA